MAIYAIPHSPAQLIPRYRYADPSTQRSIRDIYRIWQDASQKQRASFRRAMPKARVLEIGGASHYVFISNVSQVQRAVEQFLGMKI